MATLDDTNDVKSAGKRRHICITEFFKTQKRTNVMKGYYSLLSTLLRNREPGFKMGVTKEKKKRP